MALLANPERRRFELVPGAAALGAAPGRFLMGLGIGLFMIAMDTMVSPDPEREERLRLFLLVMQFYGSGIGHCPAGQLAS